MSIFLLICAVVFTVLTVWLICRIVKCRRQLETETETVRTGRSVKPAKTNLVCACMMVSIAVMNIYVDSEKIQKINDGYWDSANRTSMSVEEHRDAMRKKTEQHKDFSILIVMLWGLIGLMGLYELKNGRYMYVTDRGVYLPDTYIPAEKLRYAIKDDTLELYRGKARRPMTYSIEDKARLESMLSENYAAYTGQTE